MLNVSNLCFLKHLLLWFSFIHMFSFWDHVALWIYSRHILRIDGFVIPCFYK